MARKGMMVGTGKRGYHNVIGKDPAVHSQSAQGIKQPQRVPASVLSYINKNPDAIRKVLEEKHNIKSEKVYSFNDLPKDVQQKALDNLRDINTDHEWWEDDGLIDFSSEELKKSNFEKEYLASGDMLFKWNKIYFDLDRGAYLQFEGLKISNDDIFRKFLGVPKDLWKRLDYNFVNDRNNNTRLELNESENDKAFTPKENEIIYNAELKFGNKVNEGLSNLRKNYEYQTSDESIKETIDANEYKFNLSGKIA